MQRKSLDRLNLLAAATALMATAGSVGAVDLFGGGATFPAQAYVGPNFLTFEPDARLSRNTTNPVATTPIADLTPPDTVFARFSSATANLISYCQTGSGTGVSVLLGVGTVANANGECNSFAAAPAVAGFSGANVEPDYIGTDAPITQANATAFTGGPRTGRGGLWQIPSLAGSIALPNHAALSVPNLTVAQVCAIYSARFTTWAQIPGSGSSASIRVVFRSDNSGTSFAFTSFLAAQCNNQDVTGDGVVDIPAGYFKPNQSYTLAVPAVPGQAGSQAPLYAASASASGNAGVVSNVIANSNSVGYADFAEVAAQGAERPTVNGADPSALPASITVPSPLSGQVLDANNNPVAVTGISNPACLRLIDPDTIPTGVVYPILAYTYLNGYFSGNATKTTALRNLLGFFLSTQANRPTPPAGYAYLDAGVAYRTSVQNTINTCINN